MSHTFERFTVYSSYVFSNVLSTLAVGQGAYTMDELASMVGLKPTHNFRRRIRQMVDRGLIVAKPVFSSGKGLTAIYMLPVDETQIEEIPF